MVSVRLKKLLILVGVILTFLFGSLYHFSNSRSDYTIPEGLKSYFYTSDDRLRLLTNSGLDISGSGKNDIKFKKPQNAQFNKDFQKTFSGIFKLMDSFKDQIPTLTHEMEANQNRGFWSETELRKFVKVDEETIAKVTKIHEEIVHNIQPLRKTARDLYTNKDGIVLIGGDKFSWLSLLSIKSIRSFGTRLPIEMIIPTEEEYEYDLCEKLLPSLNAKCILLPEVLGEDLMNTMSFSGYQYKSLAILASSFNNLLLLDSDNVLLTDPERYFKNEPFKSTGMVTWPDYWERTTSPHFYDILGVSISNLQIRDGKWPLKTPILQTNKDKVKLHNLKGAIPDLSSESGQLLIRKSDHIGTLLLSLFYNVYGPNFFYKLISQGESGEGDKDTFVAGAFKMDEKYYQVSSEIQSFGYFDDGNFQGVSMGQRDPIEDYNLFQKVKNAHPHLKEYKFADEFDTRNASIFTIHANFPKLNPYQQFTEKKLLNSKGEEVRLYGDVYNFIRHLETDGEPYDFEMIQFKRMKFLLCELNISLKYFNNISRKELCTFIDSHIDFMVKHPVSEL
ncbi:hypothetical protein WICPIJ_007233 [Wickerhamomyces pijperi]|uniref:Glycosyltransferase family 71 protein n=1 Tax=Wickerhamomyces pijperi TaxID=599730 RepID=A0A9P8Q2Y6_WICPI|nr:hypothetical protein WICPIJ_007233 [Wickerhamomyces pijperi]